MIQLKNILYPTDFSDYSLHASLYAQSFATTYKAKLHVLHVVDPFFLIIDIEGVSDEPPREELIDRLVIGIEKGPR